MAKSYKKGVSIKLSENFKSTEFDCHGKGCCTETLIHEDIVYVVQNLRTHFGVPVTINSGYRCEVHNANVGGASKNSYHVKGQAADIVVRGVHPVIVARYLETLDINGRIGCYTYDDIGSGFIHVDVRGAIGGKDSCAFYTENNTEYDNVPNFHPTIKNGVRGREVIVVQRRLKALGYYTKAIDGICGNGMHSAITKFNADHGRMNDSVWGAKCWNEAFPIK